jgi:hypothetical protein
MAIPTTVADLSSTPASNSPAGTDAIGTTLDDYIRAHAAIIRQVSDAKADLTSAVLVTPNLGTPSAGVLTNCTGTAAGLSIGGNAATATTATSLIQGTLGYTLVAEQATTSGTAIDFTGIPSWVTKIYVMFKGVSISGSDTIYLRIGPSGGVETTTYSSAVMTCLYTATNTATTSGAFFMTYGGAAPDVINGRALLTLERSSTFSWALNSHLAATNSGTSYISTGTKSTASALSRLSIFMSGSNTFDAGAISIAYE